MEICKIKKIHKINNIVWYNRQFVQGTRNTYIGYDSNGMEIKMFIDMSTGEIISAFPVY